MKRDPRLVGLSTEHHHSLVLALRLRRQVEAGTADAATARHIGELFGEELEPHFQVEEEVLLPRLRDAGLDDLVERTLTDHAWLREHAARAAEGDASVLAAFAERLHDHVRFEERELFEACQELLPDAALDEAARRVPKRTHTPEQEHRQRVSD